MPAPTAAKISRSPILKGSAISPTRRSATAWASSAPPRPSSRTRNSPAPACARAWSRPEEAFRYPVFMRVSRRRAAATASSPPASGGLPGASWRSTARRSRAKTKSGFRRNDSRERATRSRKKGRLARPVNGSTAPAAVMSVCAPATRTARPAGSRVMTPTQDIRRQEPSACSMRCSSSNLAQSSPSRASTALRTASRSPGGMRPNHSSGVLPEEPSPPRSACQRGEKWMRPVWRSQSQRPSFPFSTAHANLSMIPSRSRTHSRPPCLHRSVRTGD